MANKIVQDFQLNIVGNIDTHLKKLQNTLITMESRASSLKLTGVEKSLDVLARTLKNISQNSYDTVKASKLINEAWSRTESIMQKLDVKTYNMFKSQAAAANTVASKIKTMTSEVHKYNTQVQEAKTAGIVDTAEINNVLKMRDGLVKAVSTLERLSKSIPKTKEGLNLFAGKVNEISAATTKLTTNTKAYTAALTGVTKATTKIDITSTLKNTNTLIDKNKIAISKFDSIIQNFNRSITAMSRMATPKAIASAKVDLEGLISTQKKYESILGRVNDKITKYTKALKDSTKTEAQRQAIAIKLNTTMERRTKILSSQNLAMTKANALAAKHREELSVNSSVKWAKNIAQRAVAYYGVYQAMQAVIGALRTSTEYYVEYDRAARTLAAVTEGHENQNDALREGFKLEKEVIQLTQKYGGTLAEVNKVALELARAGVGTGDLVKSTEVVAKLAKLTGDTIEKSSSVMVTYLQVFGKGADATREFSYSVEELGGKLAFMANASKLSTEDIGTFSNYALAVANSSGATIDAINAMGAALTNAGNTASTAGTSVRKFFLTLSNDASNVQGFFKAIGVSQTQLVADIAKGGETSNAALEKLLLTFRRFSKEDFNKAVSSLGIREQTALKQFYQTAYEQIRLTNSSIESGVSELEKADLVIASIGTTWQRLGQITTAVGADIVGSVITPITEGLGFVLDGSDEATKNMSTFFDVIARGAVITGSVALAVGGVMAVMASPAIIAFLASAAPIAAVAIALGSVVALLDKYNTEQNKIAETAIKNDDLIARKKAISLVKTAYEQYLETVDLGLKKESDALYDYQNKVVGITKNLAKETKQSVQAATQDIFSGDKFKVAGPALRNDVQAKLDKLIQDYMVKYDTTKYAATAYIIATNKELIESGKLTADLTKEFKALNGVLGTVSTLSKKDSILGFMNAKDVGDTLKNIKSVQDTMAATGVTSLESVSTYLDSIHSGFTRALEADQKLINSIKANDELTKSGGKLSERVYTKVVNGLEAIKKMSDPRDILKAQTDLILFQRKLDDMGIKRNDKDKDALKIYKDKLELALKLANIEQKTVKIIDNNIKKDDLVTVKETGLAMKKLEVLNGTNVDTTKYNLSILKNILLVITDSTVKDKVRNLIAEKGILLNKQLTAEKKEQKSIEDDLLKQAKKAGELAIKYITAQDGIAKAHRDALLSAKSISGENIELLRISNDLKTNEEKQTALKKEQVAIETLLIRLRANGVPTAKSANLITEAETKLAVNTTAQTQAEITQNTLEEEERRTEIMRKGSFGEAWELQSQDYIKTTLTVAEEAVAIHKTMTDSMTTGFQSFFDASSDGFMNFGQLAKSVLSSIMSEIIRMMAVKAAMSVVGFLGFSSGGQVPSSTFASGGQVPIQKFASGGLLTGGSGIKDDLYLGAASGANVFAMGGEYILNRAATNSIGIDTLNSMNNTGRVGGDGSTYINIENNSGVPIDLKEISRTQNDKGDEVIGYVMNAIERNPDFRAALKGVG